MSEFQNFSNALVQVVSELLGTSDCIDAIRVKDEGVTSLIEDVSDIADMFVRTQTRVQWINFLEVTRTHQSNSRRHTEAWIEIIITSVFGYSVWSCLNGVNLTAQVGNLTIPRIQIQDVPDDLLSTPWQVYLDRLCEMLYEGFKSVSPTTSTFLWPALHQVCILAFRWHIVQKRPEYVSQLLQLETIQCTVSSALHGVRLPSCANMLCDADWQNRLDNKRFTIPQCPVQPNPRFIPKSRPYSHERQCSRQRSHEWWRPRQRSSSQQRSRQRSRSQQRSRPRSHSQQRSRRRSRSQQRSRPLYRSQQRSRPRYRSLQRSRPRFRSQQRSRPRSHEWRRSRPRSHEWRRSRPRSHERRHSRQRSGSQQHSRQRSCSRQRSRQRSHERQRSRERSHERRHPRQFSHSRQRSSQRSHERRHPRQCSRSQQRFCLRRTSRTRPLNFSRSRPRKQSHSRSCSPSRTVLSSSSSSSRSSGKAMVSGYL